jgi:protein-export membrane protein SecD/preprotein translocase SecF subunit
MKTLRGRIFCILALAAASIFVLVPRNVTQRAYDSSTGRMHDTVVRRTPIKLGLDLRGGFHMALEIDPSKQVVTDCADGIRRAERVVRTRIDEFGTSEPVVQIVGDCRLIVELPGVTDAARARSIVQRTAFLEFHLTDSRDELKRALPTMDAALRRAGVSPATSRAHDLVGTLLRDTSAAPGTGENDHPLSSLFVDGQIPGELFIAETNVPTAERLLAREDVQRLVPRGLELRWGTHTIVREGETYRPLYAVSNRPVLTGEALIKAVAARNPLTNAAEVQFELTRAGGRQFASVTGRNIGNHLAIVLDGRVQGQPAVLTTQIGANGRIEMAGKSLEEANDLALVLRAGSLPVPLHIVEEGSIGPSLGSDSVRDGVRASLLAVGFVLLVMGVYYGVPGLLAVGALFLYILFTLGGLAAFGFALTLPGLAGFALSIGMAVDANVLIYERIREEMDAGKTVRTAVSEGFSNAMSAIVDSNVTTAFTAAILYKVGTGPVQGFAITLLVGLCASMVSAIFVTRTFFLIWLKRKPAMTRLSGFALRLFANAKFNFIGTRRLAYAASAAMILPGVVMLATVGVRYGIEFTGGTLVQVRTAQRVDAGRLRAALARSQLGSAELQSFGSDREYVIRARLDDATTAGETEAVKAEVRGALDRELGVGTYEITRGETVGPKVGGELRQKALIAVTLSFVATLVYLAFRFEWRFGLAAVLATAHDILATLAFIVYLRLEVNLVLIAALLTVLGYSLNDTIVIFDRVRENLKLRRGGTFVDLLNVSINETLPRTILTGGTTLATALVLAFFAGGVIKPFALVMSFGIVVGTFSSIFVAAPVLLWIRTRWSSDPAEGRALVDHATTPPMPR